MSRKISAWLTAAAGIFFLLMLFSDTAGALQAAQNGLLLFAETLLPSLIPFMTVNQLLLSSGVLWKLGDFGQTVMAKVFRLPGEMLPVVILSMLSGCPNGAHMVGELEKQHCFSSKQYFRSACLTSCAGPAFVIGALGSSILGSAKLGWVLWICHIISALLCAMIMARFDKRIANKVSTDSIPSYLRVHGSEPFVSILHAIGTVGCMVTLCSVLLHFLQSWGAIALFEKILTELSLSSSLAAGLCKGMIELTNGCSALALLSNQSRLKLLSFLLGFGGLSVILQSLCFLPKLSALKFMAYKLTQGLISLLLMCGYLCFLPQSIAVSNVVGTDQYRMISPWYALIVSILCLLAYAFTVMVKNAGKTT